MSSITVENEIKRERVDVNVKLLWNTQGEMIPMSVTWKDGAEFVVDRVLDVRKCASTRVGGMGYRYTVRLTNEEHKVFGKATFLFLDQARSPETWFVEGKV